MTDNPEAQRLREDMIRNRNWKRWGTYLPERQWGTVREDYSHDGSCWDHVSHDAARSKAFRWGEDGLLGLTDRQCRICFCIALWNGKDPILKERLFGLTNPQGNHGEDVKELYFYLRGTPTHSYMKGLYKYPQGAFPYTKLEEKNRRGRHLPEYELIDTGLFEEERYFDLTVEYAKASPEDVLIRISAKNCGPEMAELHLLPQLWFRNVWSWIESKQIQGSDKPEMTQIHPHRLKLDRRSLDPYFFDLDPENSAFRGLIFTENETNNLRLTGKPNAGPLVKDGFHEYVVRGKDSAVSHTKPATKAASHHILRLAPGEERSLRFRLTREADATDAPFEDFDRIMASRIAEMDQFYSSVLPPAMDTEAREICLQSYAGLIWSKQFYYYSVEDWFEGNFENPLTSKVKAHRRNGDWKHVFARDVLSMPDKWEYPWFAAWDLAFHMVPYARIDAAFAKQQLLLLLREWYMHPNGQIPAYEFSFRDVNPPVHAWAALRVYEIDAKRTGVRDRNFLYSIFHKLLLNFTWWVNRTDERGQNLFAGGFLGMDNIGIFDRGAPLPGGGHLQQSDATAWMAFYSVCMLRIALELAWDGETHYPPYEDMASKFLSHFVQIADAMHTHGGEGLWSETDGFYYDQIAKDDGRTVLRTRSLVGLLPLIAVDVISDEHLTKLPEFSARFEWHSKHQPGKWKRLIHEQTRNGGGRKMLLALVSKERLLKVLRYMLDEDEFLSKHGIRSLSKFHKQHPFRLTVEGSVHEVKYTPGESETGMFGGNSNWRGPVWFPVNHLLIEALERYHAFYGDTLKIEYPSHAGTPHSLKEVAADLKRRHTSLFRRNENGHSPALGLNPKFANHPAWNHLHLFHEFFHGDSGEGLGASHQTGWTALVATHLEDLAGG
jgi:hypothetical protein